MSDTRKLTLRCPDCNSHLVVDAATGEVISHRKQSAPRADAKSLEALLEDLDVQKEQAEDIFEREMDALKDRDRLLEDKFADALERAKEQPEDEPPMRPFDLD